MALSESEELELLRLKKRRALANTVPTEQHPAPVAQAADAGPTALDRAVDFVSPVTNVLGWIGQRMEEGKKASGYNYSPQGLLEGGMGFVQRGAGRLGEFAAEELARKGVNPYASSLAGMGVTFAPDIAMGVNMPPLNELGVSAQELATRGMKTTAKATIPPIVRGTAGIPVPATNEAIESPSILKRLAGTEQSVASKMGSVIDLVDQAKRSIGAKFGRIYRRYAGMEGPMQDIIDTPIAQEINPITSEVPVAQGLKRVESPRTGTGMTDISYQPGDIITENKITGFKPGRVKTVPRQTSSYDDLLINNKFAEEAFSKNDTGALNYLYKKYISPNTNLREVTITNANKMEILTRLKREIQAEANLNKNPMTLRPIDTAKDAAFKKMASSVDEMRGELPNGQKLAMVDDAWKEINDIYGTIQKDLADPGKARDTLMRLLKGDTTWLTSGRFANKLNAIKRVESLTGQNILKPAMQELTAMIFNEPFGRGLITQTYPLMAAGAGASALLRGNLPEAALAFGSIPLASPRAIGLGLRGAAKVGGKLAQGAGFVGRNAVRMGFIGQKALKAKEESQ